MPQTFEMPLIVLRDELPTDRSTGPRYLDIGLEPSWDLGTELPSSVQLAFLRDARLRVQRPFAVRLSIENGTVVAEAEDLEEYGSGETFSEAVADLQHAIAELYFALEDKREVLGLGLQRTRELLRSKIETRA